MKMLLSAHFETLTCNNFVRTHQIITVFSDHFVISIQCTIVMYKLIFNLGSSVSN